MIRIELSLESEWSSIFRRSSRVYKAARPGFNPGVSTMDHHVARILNGDKKVDAKRLININ